MPNTPVIPFKNKNNNSGHILHLSLSLSFSLSPSLSLYLSLWPVKRMCALSTPHSKHSSFSHSVSQHAWLLYKWERCDNHLLRFSEIMSKGNSFHNVCEHQISKNVMLWQKSYEDITLEKFCEYAISCSWSLNQPTTT